MRYDRHSMFMIGVAFGSIVGCITLGIISENTDDMRDSAIEAGVGEYYIDDDQSKQWRWIEQEAE